MSKLSTHVLDTCHGRPAAGLTIELFRLESGGARTLLQTAATNADGRTDAPLLSGEAVQAGSYELLFHLGAYFQSLGVPSPFLDEVPVRFAMEAGGSYHVPLLASPWAYTTYRGS
ncbi:MAG: hydroxyisourate hydrolase [Verrucomicrobium sp.]|nr:hydroxyisourate hydrolase [Verrucomicrobium sp.]